MHALHERLLAAGEEHPHVEVLRWIRVQLRRERERCGHAGRVVVGGRDDGGELDLDQTEDPDEQDQREWQLQDRGGVRVNPGEPEPQDGKEDGRRPEQVAKGSERERQEVVEALGEANPPRPERAAGARGVDVRGDDQTGPGIRVAALRKDVLGGATEEEAPEQVDAGVQVEVHRGGREEDQREPDGRRGDREEAAREGQQAVKRLDERHLRMHVDRLDIDAAARRAQASGQMVGGAPLGIRAGQPVLERAELVDRLHALVDRHGFGIIAALRGYRCRSRRSGGTADSRPSKGRARKSVWVRIPPPASRRLRAPVASLDPMCGRYTLTNPDPIKLRQRFLVGESATEFEPRFNVAPTDAVPAVRLADGGERELGRLRWGLVPGRWAEKSSGRPLINARVESISSQPAFAESFRERRCLIPADGFYEWRRDENGKTPCWITLRDGGLFAFAGIWAAIPARASGGRRRDAPQLLDRHRPSERADQADSRPHARHPRSGRRGRLARPRAPRGGPAGAGGARSTRSFSRCGRSPTSSTMFATTTRA